MAFSSNSRLIYFYWKNNGVFPERESDVKIVLRRFELTPSPSQIII